MKLYNEYINKQYLINMLGCVHPEDRNWEEAISIIENYETTKVYPINWIDTSFLDYNLNDICEKPYIIALPIKVGDEVYVDSSSSSMLKVDGCSRKGKIVSISLNMFSIIFSVRFNESETKDGLPITYYFSLEEINQKVFLKKDEN